MLFFIYDGETDFPYSIKFESHDLDHTHIEVSFDGLAYRFPKKYIQDWLDYYDIRWFWICKKTEVWLGEPYILTIEPHTKPPTISFMSESDAAFFKITWEHGIY